MVGTDIFVFGGYDVHRTNHNSVHIFDTKTLSWRLNIPVSGQIPRARNGHSATLAERNLIVVGGWIGTGPLAAQDTFVLNVGESSYI